MTEIPLSFAQRRLWFLGRLHGPSAAYNAPVVVRLDAVPDTAALGAALADVVERHEVLRTVLPAGADAEPFQRVLETAAVPGLTTAECTPGGLDAAVAAFTRQAIDITAEPPLRARLLLPGDGTSVLVLLIHHVATDGWSVRPLLRDLSEAYGARLAGREPDRSRCRSSTRTTASGSTSCSATPSTRTASPTSRWRTGGRSWPVPRRSSPCPPTGRARRNRRAGGPP